MAAPAPGPMVGLGGEAEAGRDNPRPTRPRPTSTSTWSQALARGPPMGERASPGLCLLTSYVPSLRRVMRLLGCGNQVACHHIMRDMGSGTFAIHPQQHSPVGCCPVHPQGGGTSEADSVMRRHARDPVRGIATFWSLPSTSHWFRGLSC